MNKVKIVQFLKKKPILMAICTIFTACVYQISPQILQLLIDSSTFVGVLILILQE